MSIVQVSGKGGHMAPERTPFVGARVPAEIKALPKLLKTLDKSVFRKILKVLVQYYEGEDPGNESIQEVADSLSEETFSQVFSGLDALLRCALKMPDTSLKQQLFKEDLAELRIPEAFILDLASVVFGARVLSRVLEPTILAELQLTDGTKRTFEMPIAKFHQLRYNVAQILKDMDNLEQRNILKIQD